MSGVLEYRPGLRTGAPRRWRVGPVQSLWYPRAALVALLAGSVAAIVAMGIVGTGKLHLSPAEILAALRDPDGSPAARIVWQLRLPRAATGAATGACLGVAGLLFQSLSRNALGSPEIIGLVSGAALGATSGVTLMHTTGWTTAVAAVVGCAIAAALGQLLTLGSRGAATRLVLVGIGLSALWSSLTSLLLTRTDPDVAVGAQIWLTGTLNARTWQHALIPGVALLIVIPVTLAASRHLEVAESGPELSSQLGLRPGRLVTVVATLGIVLTAAAIAATGPISFVALAAPHVTTRLVGRPAVPVFTTAVVGASLLLGAEYLAHQLPESSQVPVGIATSVLGGAYLLAMMIRRAR